MGVGVGAETTGGFAGPVDKGVGGGVGAGVLAGVELESDCWLSVDAAGLLHPASSTATAAEMVVRNAFKMEKWMGLLLA